MFSCIVDCRCLFFILFDSQEENGCRTGFEIFSNLIVTAISIDIVFDLYLSAFDIYGRFVCTSNHACHRINGTDQKTQRQTGRQAQLSNISAARAVADIIRTTLGPRSMLKVRLFLFLLSFHSSFGHPKSFVESNIAFHSF